MSSRGWVTGLTSLPWLDDDGSSADARLRPRACLRSEEIALEESHASLANAEASTNEASGAVRRTGGAAEAPADFDARRFELERRRAEL
jgi:hypothetical protein